MSDPEEFTRYITSTGDQNNTGLKSEDVDSLFEKQAKAMDPAERKRIVREIDMKLLEIVPCVILYWQRGNIAHWPEVKNYYRGNAYSTNKYEDVWLAK